MSEISAGSECAIAGATADGASKMHTCSSAFNGRKSLARKNGPRNK